MRTATQRVLTVGLLGALPSPAIAAPSPARLVTAAIILLFGLATLYAVARVADSEVRWRRTRRRPPPAFDATPAPIRTRVPRRWPRRILRIVGYAVLLALAYFIVALAFRPEDYPDGWPWPRPSIARLSNGCPNIEGEYAGVDAAAWDEFGYGDARARWRDHYARIEQADGGATIRVTLGLDANGLRARRGLRPATLDTSSNFRGRGEDFSLIEGRDFECRGGWIYSLTRHDVRIDGTHYVDARLRRDLSGGLVIGSTTEWTRTFSVWAGSPGVDLGQARETRWTRLPPRDPGDDAATRALEGGVVVERRPYWKGPHEIALVESFVDAPVCMRLVSTLVTGFGTTRTTMPVGIDDRGPAVANDPHACPKDAGRVPPVDTIPLALDPSEPGIGRRYVIEWASRAATPRRWASIPIDDPRALPLSTRCDELRGHGSRQTPCR